MEVSRSKTFCRTIKPLFTSFQGENQRYQPLVLMASNYSPSAYNFWLLIPWAGIFDTPQNSVNDL